MAITAKRADFPQQVWLGIVNGQWPLKAWHIEAQAQAWAAEANETQPRYVLGPIDLDLDVEVRKAHFVPSMAIWTDD